MEKDVRMKLITAEIIGKAQYDRGIIVREEWTITGLDDGVLSKDNFTRKVKFSNMRVMMKNYGDFDVSIARETSDID